jgi:hypothetical protein
MWSPLFHLASATAAMGGSCVILLRSGLHPDLFCEEFQVRDMEWLHDTQPNLRYCCFDLNQLDSTLHVWQGDQYFIISKRRMCIPEKDPPLLRRIQLFISRFWFDIVPYQFPVLFALLRVEIPSRSISLRDSPELSLLDR